MTNIKLPKKYQNDPQLNVVQLGLDVQHFLSSHDRLGKYLQKRAGECRDIALNELVIVDPTDTEKVRELQWQALIPTMLLDWLDEAIAAGKMAEVAIQEDEDAGY